jgi:hypothetical protein
MAPIATAIVIASHESVAYLASVAVSGGGSPGRLMRAACADKLMERAAADRGDGRE